MYVSSLEGTGYSGWPLWQAEVTITVLDEYDSPVAGATVSGSWIKFWSVDDGCTTNGNGQCTVDTQDWWWVDSVVFIVSDVTHATFICNADISETSIVIQQP